MRVVGSSAGFGIDLLTCRMMLMEMMRYNVELAILKDALCIWPAPCPCRPCLCYKRAGGYFARYFSPVSLMCFHRNAKRLLYLGLCWSYYCDSSNYPRLMSTTAFSLTSTHFCSLDSLGYCCCCR
ncbi:hypothetical protein BC939DRAFT_454010 [Gamsiella multidivaricata]|uniref:uncharacterized protein n=1 Tax=Gamsiella multidivaricata TaxID=101098 RepID=UPI00221F93DF|nr:uncharacterized protein BC939DRAFT_454010 [Gamsiella multidivaricata]KAI7822399.1 hypothetical protein BC939DRAFT_454010 [Gamsiella multidivaricata]